MPPASLSAPKYDLVAVLRTTTKYNVYGRGCGVNRTINDERGPEGELLMCINAEPRGRGINARLTQNRFHKRYSTATKKQLSAN